MVLVTLYALFGDDLRLLAFERGADPVFLWLNVVALTAFTLEIVLSSIGVKGYFGSFFFWLDLLSTVSIITDIEPIWNAVTSQQQHTALTVEAQENTGAQGDAELMQEAQRSQSVVDSSVQARTGKMMRIVRLIRLIRIVKLYKSANQHMQREETKRLIQDMVKEEADGAHLSESLT